MSEHTVQESTDKVSPALTATRIWAEVAALIAAGLPAPTEVSIKAIYGGLEHMTDPHQVEITVAGGFVPADAWTSALGLPPVALAKGISPAADSLYHYSRAIQGDPTWLGVGSIAVCVWTKTLRSAS